MPNRRRKKFSSKQRIYRKIAEKRNETKFKRRPEAKNWESPSDTLDSFVALMQKLADAGKLKSNSNDENMLIVTWQDCVQLFSKDPNKAYTVFSMAKDRTKSVGYVGFINLNNSKLPREKHVFRISKTLLDKYQTAQKKQLLKLTHPLVKYDCTAILQARKKSKQAFDARKWENKEKLFKSLEQWAKTARPFISQYEKEFVTQTAPYGDSQTAPALKLKLFKWLAGQKRALKRKTVLNKTIQKDTVDLGEKYFLFKDPDKEDFIWIYNCHAFTGKRTFQAINRYLQKQDDWHKTKDKNLFNIISAYPVTNKAVHRTPPRNKSLIRLNLGCLSRHPEILSKKVLIELQAIDACPAQVIECIRKLTDFRQDLSENKQIDFCLLKIMKSQIEKNGFWDGNYYFLTHQTLRKIKIKLAAQGFTIPGLVKKIGSTINFYTNNKKSYYKHKEWGGFAFDITKINKALDHLKIDPINQHKVPPLSIMIDKRSSPGRKGRMPQQFIQLDHNDHSLIPPSVTAIPKAQQQSEIPKQLAKLLESNAPIQLDLRNPNHLTFLQQQCKRPVTVSEEDRESLAKLRVVKIYALDYEELGDQNRPWGVIVVAPDGIKKDTKICEYGGDVITNEQANQEASNYQCTMSLNHKYCKRGSNIGTFLNQGEPNARYEREPHSNTVNIVATCDIPYGQQVLVKNYGDADFLTRDKLNKEVDPRIKREIFLNSHCDHRSFDDLLAQYPYERLPWDERLTSISQHFYGNCDYDLSATPLIKAILAVNVAEMSNLLEQTLELLHQPLIRINKEPAVQAAPKHEQNSISALALAVYAGNIDVILTLLHQPQIHINIRRLSDGQVPINDALLSPSSAKLEILKILLHFGASPVLQSADDEYMTLHYCVIHGLSEQAKLILDSWVNYGNDLLQLVSYINRNNEDYLMLALQYNRLDFLHAFLEKYAQTMARSDDEDKCKPKKGKKRKIAQPTIEDQDKLFYFENDDEAVAHSTASKSSLSNMVIKLQNPQQLLLWFEQYPELFYPRFVKLTNKIMVKNNADRINFIKEAEKYCAYFANKDFDSTFYGYLDKANLAYSKALALATTEEDKKFIQDRLDKLKSIKSNWDVYPLLEDYLKDCARYRKKPDSDFNTDKLQKILNERVKADQGYAWVNHFFITTQHLFDQAKNPPLQKKSEELLTPTLTSAHRFFAKYEKDYRRKAIGIAAEVEAEPIKKRARTLEDEILADLGESVDMEMEVEASSPTTETLIEAEPEEMNFEDEIIEELESLNNKLF